MAKAKKTEEPIESRSDDVDAIIARIAEFNKKTEAMRSKVLDGTVAKDMYLLDIKRPDSDNAYIQEWFHGRCIKSGFKEYDKCGYVYIISRHIAENEKPLSRTRCVYCKGLLNPHLAAELDKEGKERYEKLKAEYERKQQFKQVQEEEMVLLGML